MFHVESKLKANILHFICNSRAEKEERILKRVSLKIAKSLTFHKLSSIKK